MEGCHEAIIDKDVFLRVQAEIARRSNLVADGKKRIYSGSMHFLVLYYAATAAMFSAGLNGITEASNLLFGAAQAGWKRTDPTVRQER